MDLIQDKSNSRVIPRPRSVTRPECDQSPTEISVGIYTLDIAKINEVEQSVVVDFYLGLQWHDPRLAQLMGDRHLLSCQQQLDQVWHPNIHIINQRQLTKEFKEIVEINSEGMVTYRQRFHGEFTAHLDLKRFPFDEQLLKLEIMSFSYSPEEITFVAGEHLNGIGEEVSLVNWSIEGITTHSHAQFIKPEQRYYARFDYGIKVKRYSSFYAWRVLLPVGLIVFMSDLVFWIDPSQVIPQITLATATMMSLITYQFVLRQELPRMAYLTAEDKVIIGAMLLVFVGLVESVTSINLVSEGYPLLALHLDEMLRWLVPISFFTLAALAFLI